MRTPHKLESLRALGARLEIIELNRKNVSGEDDPGWTDRQAAGQALVAVIAFLREIGFERRSLERLKAALADVVLYGRYDELLTSKHPASDPLDSQGYKGVCAGVMELLLKKGWKHGEASEWIAAHAYGPIEGRRITGRTIEEWYDRYGGERGEKGFAYDRYLAVRQLAVTDEGKLAEILNVPNYK